MSVRQYIGARYVTKIYENSLDPSSAEWEQGTFEPLVMVTWQNSTYLSKKQVPGSVGDPANNPNYWVCTGYYNGQILSLQNQIDYINNTVIPALYNAISTGISLKDRHILFIMDSYGTHVTSGGLTLDAAIDTIVGSHSTLICANGAGAVNGAFLTLVNTYAGDPLEFDTVCLIGGANDQHNSSNDIITALDTLYATIKSTFTNAKQIVTICCGLTFKKTSLFNCANRETLWKAYKDAALKNDTMYVDNGQYIFRNTQLLEADKLHPNAAGMDALVDYVIKGLLTGSVDVHYSITTNFSHTDTSQPDVNYRMTRDNAMVTLTKQGGVGLLFACNVVTYADASQQEIYGTFDDTLIDNQEDYGLFDSGIIGKYEDSGNVQWMSCRLLITDGIFEGFCLKLNSNYSTTGDHFVMVGNGISFAN